MATYYPDADPKNRDWLRRKDPPPTTENLGITFDEDGTMLQDGKPLKPTKPSDPKDD